MFSRRRRRLLDGQLARTLLESQLGGADRNGARGHEHHFEPAVLKIADGAHQLLDAADIRLAVVVGQRRGADLDDDAPHLFHVQHSK